MVGGAVCSKTMREAALYLTGFQRRDTYEVSIELTPEVATERLRLLRVCREMQVGEKDLAAAKLRAFRQLRFLDLHDHVGLRKN